MAKLKPAQLKRFRFFREKGATISEARRLARMTGAQMADELRRRLRAASTRSKED